MSTGTALSMKARGLAKDAPTVVVTVDDILVTDFATVLGFGSATAGGLLAAGVLAASRAKKLRSGTAASTPPHAHAPPPPHNNL
jgi:hypothetical protein